MYLISAPCVSAERQKFIWMDWVENGRDSRDHQ